MVTNVWEICSPKNQILALEAARNGIVLLKNDAKLLPLPKSMSLAVIGPNADSPQTRIGNYAGPPWKSVAPLQALKSYVKNTVYHPCCNMISCSTTAIEKAVDIAKRADYVVLIMGLDQTQEREALDRMDLGPIDVSFAKDDPRIGGILWTGYPGEGGGGRLPITWYPQDFTKVLKTDMRRRPEPSTDYPGRTYRFYKGDKVFEFGYGLSYSKYWYTFTRVSRNNLYLNHSSSLRARETSDSVRYKLFSELSAEV
ncbi:putative beta-D-xylosidase 7 [Hibiscus syriacus]|uniref:Beta-D-xylosidase 7 n=1 Tax=Hibiscus syriacus TaxID=106335 RepID=A0A6A2ZY36_HIBSY|nr:putative beta-D-xylosidase 7 [Hibiscus syriacus]